MKATGIVRRIGDSLLNTLTQDMVFCMSVESAAERYIGK